MRVSLLRLQMATTLGMLLVQLLGALMLMLAVHGFRVLALTLLLRLVRGRWRLLLVACLILLL